MYPYAQPKYTYTYIYLQILYVVFSRVFNCEWQNNQGKIIKNSALKEILLLY